MKLDLPNPSVAPFRRRRDPRAARCSRRASAVLRATQGAVVVTLLWGGLAVARDADDDRGSNDAVQVRQHIDRQVGGLQKLMVPANNASIPVPREADGSIDPSHKTTEAKRFLGKMLFHDPVRTARVNRGNFGQNEGQPLDLPQGTAFGGTLRSRGQNDPKIQAIVDATKQTGSCGSCHIGEASSKAGQLLNFNTGGEGRGYTDEKGNFVPRRRPQSMLAKVRREPIFPGDLRVDLLPTLTDIFIDSRGLRTVTTPALFYHDPKPTALLQTGRLDQLDSVGRQSPSIIGLAFNNRLLFGGFGGEPRATIGSLQPDFLPEEPAAENIALLLLDAHRMLNFQAAELQRIPAFVKLFENAFPEEAAEAKAKNKPDILINDVTEFRAQATFMRTVVTRNTPFDRFLAGDNKAMTRAQVRGARLFFTPATGGAGGAGCFSCHSGPMLNKQHDDPDVAGVGHFVEENFNNVGIGDHPIQAENAVARGRLDANRLGADSFPYHAEDTGREEVTHNPNDVFKFRTMTLRQLKSARNFLHSGSFTNVHDVVEYFNAGAPQDPTAGAAPTLSARFTAPRGPGYPGGLGLSKKQVDDLTAFLEDGLFDPAFVKFDPKSSTDTFQPNVRDLTYSKRRDLAGIPGLIDGLMPSGLAIDDNDPLSRRDQGLEFLDVTSQLSFTLIDSDPDEDGTTDRYRVTNHSQSVVDTHLLIVAKGLPNGARLRNASGVTKGGDPYLRVFLRDGVLMPGQSIVRKLAFSKPERARLRYALDALSGQGKP